MYKMSSQSLVFGSIKKTSVHKVNLVFNLKITGEEISCFDMDYFGMNFVQRFHLSTQGSIIDRYVTHLKYTSF